MIYIGSDHAGFKLKTTLIAYLNEKKIPCTDMGCNGETVDYPDIAKSVCGRVLESPENKGILVCGTGIGISMAANRIRGIRAANCCDCYSVRLTRKHNDANVICFGERVLGAELACELLDFFLNTAFEGGRHQNRVNKIEL
jgi:ribose 5-phosphate isomerase B